MIRWIGHVKHQCVHHLKAGSAPAMVSVEWDRALAASDEAQEPELAE